MGAKVRTSSSQLTSAHRPSVHTHQNADNAKGRRLRDLTNLGTFETATECQVACTKQLGSDPTSGCTSYTFYHADYYKSNLALTCFGDNSGSWFPFYSDLGQTSLADGTPVYGNVTSGQVTHGWADTGVIRKAC